MDTLAPPAFARRIGPIMPKIMNMTHIGRFARSLLSPGLGFALLLGGPAWSQAPGPVPTPPPAPTPAPPSIIPQAVITAPASVPSGSPSLVLFADKSTSATPLTWKLISPKGAYFVYDQSDKKNILLVIPYPPDGMYRFALVASGSIPGTYDFDLADVPVGSQPNPGPGPVPSPTPTPAPAPVPPAPTPLAKGFIITLVTDSAAMTAPLAAVRDSVTLPPAITSLGGRYTTVDVASAEYLRRNLAPFLTSKDAAGDAVTPPALVVQDAKAKVIHKIAAPADEASVLAYLKTLTGGN